MALSNFFHSTIRQAPSLAAEGITTWHPTNATDDGAGTLTASSGAAGGTGMQLIQPQGVGLRGWVEAGHNAVGDYCTFGVNSSRNLSDNPLYGIYIDFNGVYAPIFNGNIRTDKYRPRNVADVYRIEVHHDRIVWRTNGIVVETLLTSPPATDVWAFATMYNQGGAWTNSRTYAQS